jgi:signal transduction histidine kinase
VRAGEADAVNRVTKRLSLRAQMTASYLLVTAAAVLLAEVVILAVAFPQALADAGLPAQVRNTASLFVKDAHSRLAKGQPLPSTGEDLFRLRAPEPAVIGGDVPVAKVPRPWIGDASGDAPTIPIELIGGTRPDDEPVGFVLLLNPDGTVRASSYPGRYPPGSRGSALPKPAAAGLSGDQEGTLSTPAGEARWVSMPIIVGPFDKDFDKDGGGKPHVPSGPKGGGPDAKGGVLPDAGDTTLPPDKAEALLRVTTVEKRVVGSVYVQVPAGAGRPSLLGAIGPAVRMTGPALAIGLGLLLFTLPIGVVFGLLSTRRLTRRVQRLAATTTKVADGDLSLRVPVDGSDEVSQLERAFNGMAARLGEGIAVERQLAGANARLAERARIARELHDAISQSLFSLGMLTGGLRRALPGGSPLAEQVISMESTVNRMSQEMRALLLELRPAALEEAGLVPALEELCRTYANRLGVAVNADLDEVALPAPAEHAVLRLVQEGLANAVRHGDPTTVEVALVAQDGRAIVSVSDDGCGFDPAGVPRWGMGLKSMRERVEELGGTFELIAEPERGTCVRAELPTRSPDVLGGDWGAFMGGRGSAWPA